MQLVHCFGARPTHHVDTSLAVAMLHASGCRYLAVNTHTIDDVVSGDDLPVGYATATLGSVLKAVGDDLQLTPVLNINHPTTAAEAVSRARRAVELTGVELIKLEVLDDSLTVSRNDEVVDAAGQLLADGLAVWPLITADPAAFEACIDLGSDMVRVMGSPIGTRRGIDPATRPVLERIVPPSPVPVMLDGGIAAVSDVIEAAELGFSSFLVNSCLFTAGTDPVRTLREFRIAATAGSPAGVHTAVLEDG
jgi:thiazole synthase